MLAGRRLRPSLRWPGLGPSPVERASAEAVLLNGPQTAAVTHRGGPILVLAGAGTGKTRVIIHRIAHLLAQGVGADQILAVTFTNRAADEMRGRLRQLCGAAARAVTLGTFHALGLQLLRGCPQAVGLQPKFSIYDASDQLGLLRELMRRVKVADRRLDAPRLLQIILDTKRRGHQAVPLVWGDDYELAAYDLYPTYLEHMQALSAVDFDDLILLARKLLQTERGQAHWAGRWQHFLVDEYQDTSPQQLDIIVALAGAQPQVCAVGDDDQAIYAWRGASHDNILRFSATFAGHTEVKLEENYRCTGNILAAANYVIQQNPKRRPKTLWSAGGAGAPVAWVACADEQDEAAYVVQTLLARLADGAAADQCAVLYRSNQQGRRLEEALREEGIAYRVVGGQAFYDRKEVRDVIAYLALCSRSSDDMALRRIINTPARGLGPKSVAALADWAAAQRSSLWQALETAQSIDGLCPAARAGARQLQALVLAHRAPLAAAQTDSTAQTAVAALVADCGLREAVVAADDSPKQSARRLSNLEAVQASFGRYVQRQGPGKATLSDFVRRQALGSEAPAEPASGCVTLMTLHAAKGQEFADVILVGVEEDLLPHHRVVAEHGDLGEERRLLYVGMTRARQRLSLTWARQRGRHGRQVPRSPSRFVDGLGQMAGVNCLERNGSDDGEGGGDEPSAAAERFFAQMRAHLGLEPTHDS